MGRASKSTAMTRLRPSSVQLFEMPVLFPAEETAGYAEMLSEIAAHVKAVDPIEQSYVRDLIAATLELQRYRRYKTSIIEGALPRALEQKLSPLLDGDYRFGALPRFSADGAREPTPAAELVNKWIAQDPEAIHRVDEIMAAAKVTMDDVRAHAFLLMFDTIERIDRLIAGTESRRNSILREIDHYRAARKHALQTAGADVEEAEFELVPRDRNVAG